MIPDLNLEQKSDQTTNDALFSIAQAIYEVARALDRQQGLRTFRYQLADYWGFDYSVIGIEVVESDVYGPSILRYDGMEYTRRSSSNKNYAPGVWYSRAIGKDEESKMQYETLIKFGSTKSQAEDLPQHVQDEIKRLHNGKK